MGYSLWGCKESDTTEHTCTYSSYKHALPMQETQEMWVLSLGWEDPLKKDMGTHSSIFAWRIPWTEAPGGIQSMGLQRAGHGLALSFFLYRNRQGSTVTVCPSSHLDSLQLPVSIVYESIA